MHRNTLRLRVTAWYVGLLAVALIVSSAAVYLGVRAFITSSLERILINSAQSITSNFLASIEEKGQTWFLGEISESYPSGSSDRFVRITSRNKVLYSTGDMRDPFVSTSTLPLPAQPAWINAIHRETLASGESVMIYTMPFKTPSGRPFLVETGATVDSIGRVTRSLALILFITTPTILLAAALGGFFLMKLPLRPVVVITEQAEHIGRKDLGERLPVIATGDELERLALSLNRMIDRLEEALAHNHRFSADASHELRTPLTILQGELEELLRRQDLPAPALEGLASSLEEIQRMSRIVHSLMAISRLDGGERVERLPLDLAHIAYDTAEHMRLLAEEKSITLVCLPSAPVFVSGDAMRLKQVVVNLLDNAIKYTLPGGEVHVSVFPELEQAVLQVTDSGIGISAAALPFVFERFYRADKARSRESGGVGLGLSIVRSISAAHEGSVTLSSVEALGTTINVLLPLLELSRLARIQ